MAERVAIIEARRTPIGKFLGSFREHSAVQLGTGISRAVLDLCGIGPDGVDEMYFGHGRQAGCGPNPARQVTIAAGLSDKTPAVTINAACASGTKSIALGVESIRRGDAQCVLAGGTASGWGIGWVIRASSTACTATASSARSAI